jgi:exopolysaccharide production protein ExoQ
LQHLLYLGFNEQIFYISEPVICRFIAARDNSKIGFCMAYLSSKMVLSGVAIVILPVAIFAPKGLAPLFAVAAVSLIAGPDRMAIFRTASGIIKGDLISISLVAGFVLAALSGLWSLTPVESLRTALALAVTFVGGIILLRGAALLEDTDRRFIGNALLIGGAIGLVLVAVEQTQDGILTRAIRHLVGKETDSNIDFGIRLNPAGTLVALFTWPLALVLFGRLSRSLAVIAIAASVGVILLSESEAPIFAFTVGAIVFAISLTFRRVAAIGLAVLIIAGVALAPVIVGFLPDPVAQDSRLPEFSRGSSKTFNSVYHRFYIWQTAVGHILQNPMLGLGFDTSRALYGQDSKRSVVFFPGQPEKSWKGVFEPIPLHPHNGILQIWLELGALGAFILIGLLTGILRGIDRAAIGALEKAICHGVFTTAITLASVSFGIWQSWWLSAIFLIAALTVAATSNSRNEVIIEAPKV